MYRKLKQLAGRMHEWLEDSSGPTVVEYAVMLALIVLVSMSAIQALGMWNAQVFAYLANNVPG